MEYKISTILLLIGIVVYFTIKIGAKRYIDEKAKNLATLQDINKITEKIESVKTEYINQSYAWKKFFDFELDNIKNVWTASWELQVSASSLMPILDRVPQDEEERKKMFLDRYKDYGGKMSLFRDAVMKNKPFIPPTVYKSSEEIRHLVIPLQVEFESNMKQEREPNWEMIVDKNEELDIKIEELNELIRAYIYGKLEPRT